MLSHSCHGMRAKGMPASYRSYRALENWSLFVQVTAAGPTPPGLLHN